MLKNLGRARGQQWLQSHYGQIGKCSTVDLEALFY